MLYSQSKNRFYDDLDYVADDLDDGQTLADLRLCICGPDYVPWLDAEFLGDEYPDESLPREVEHAMKVFNDSVAGIVVAWHPLDLALDVD